MTRFEIVATLITFEQENLISPIKLSFRTIQRVLIENGYSYSNNCFTCPMVLWRDYLIGTFERPQPGTHGLFLWNMRENSLFYFKVCHSFFPSLSALNPISRQMEFIPRGTKVIDDLLFTICHIYDGTDYYITYRCVHIPSLVISTQLPGGSLSLMEDAFAVLLPKCIMRTHAMKSPSYPHTTIYSIPTCPPTHPRYCFIIKEYLEHSLEAEWEVHEVEIGLSVPGPIKVFSRVSQQYTIRRQTILSDDSNDDLLLYLPLGHRDSPYASLSIGFLRVGKPSKERLVSLRGVDGMRLSGLRVDRDAGYVILWAEEDSPQRIHDCSFIWWLNGRKPSNMVHSRTRGLISSWSCRLLRRI